MLCGSRTDDLTLVCSDSDNLGTFYAAPRAGFLPRLARPIKIMESATNDFGGFGEGFSGFPRRLPDDTVEYTICLLDQTLKDTEIRQRLRNVQTAANTLTKELLKDFIWQREGFALKLVREEGNVLKCLFTSLTLV